MISDLPRFKADRLIATGDGRDGRDGEMCAWKNEFINATASIVEVDDSRYTT